MRWVLVLLFIAVVFVVLWKSGFFKDFLEPWKAWANWIGYFQ